MIKGFFPFGHLACNLWITLDVLLCTSSIWHMCVISIDRYFTIKSPLKYGCYKTRKYMVLKIILVWVLASIISSPLLIIGITNPDYVFNSMTSTCALEHSQFKIYGSILAFYIPLFIIAVTYFFTMKSLKNLMRTKEKSDVVAENSFKEFLRKKLQFFEKQDKSTGACKNKASDEAHVTILKNNQKKCSYDLTSSRINSCLTTFSSVSNYRNRFVDDRRDSKVHTLSNKNEEIKLLNCCKIRPIHIKSKSLTHLASIDDRTAQTKHWSSIRLDDAYQRLSLPIIQEPIAEDKDVPNAVGPGTERDTLANEEGKVNISNLEIPFLNRSKYEQLEFIEKNGELKNIVKLKCHPNDQLRIEPFHKTKRPKISRVYETDAVKNVNKFLYVDSPVAFIKTSPNKIEKYTDYQVQTRFFRANNERKALKVLIIIFVIFVALWTPFFVLNILSALCKCEFITNSLMSFCTWSGYASSMVNPIIYTVFNKSFRKAFIDLLTCKTKHNRAKRRKLLLYQIYTHSKMFSSFSKRQSKSNHI
jgi:hypothetical protein